MKEKITTMQSGEGLKSSQSDWKRLRDMQDEDIDHSDSPELGPEFWASTELIEHKPKERVSARFDPEVLEYFRQQGRGYQTRMNAVLRSYVQAQKAKDGPKP